MLLPPRARKRLALVGAVLVWAAGCTRTDTTSPAAPDDFVTELKSSAFVATIDLQRSTITIKTPGTTGSPAAHATKLAAPARGASRSILAGDAVEITTANLTRSAVGAFSARKIRVRFDASIVNKLRTVALTTPTFPAPPPGVSGVFLIPFAASNNAIVATDWDGNGSPGSGERFNFFNDPGCKHNDTDCFRWEAFASPILPGTSSAARTVGFDVDPEVTTFTVSMIVAANLRDDTPTPPGAISGTVTSPQAGPLGGVTVLANPGAYGAATAVGTGAYTINGVPPGAASVSLNGLPTGCTDPGAQNVTVVSGATASANFVVTCALPLVANAGADQDRNRGEATTLDGSASTGPSGFTYTWTQVSGPDVTGGTGSLSGASPTFTAPATVSTLEFDLRVSAGSETSAPDRVVIWVFEDKNNTMFVAQSGDDGNAGTRLSPKRTITGAIASIPGGAGTDVYVAAGGYSGQVTLMSGTSVYGGYSDGSWLRTGLPTTVSGGTTAVLGSGIANVTVDGLRILSANASGAGQSSYGVRLMSPGVNVVISGNTIVPGNGSNGVNGSSGAAGPRGQDGGSGTRTVDGASSPPQGGVGGAVVAGGLLGGTGGAGGSPGGPGQGGALGGGFGVGTSAGSGGPGGSSGTNAGNGQPGQNGANGSHGAAGTGGGSFGSVAAGLYSPSNGTTGGSSQGGAGGGGGGGGGGYEELCFLGVCVTQNYGNGGGGGGSGGGSAVGGSGGTGGGGSFGIFIVSAAAPVTISGNTITTGHGGDGGDGGLGGIGGFGGLGGPGGNFNLLGVGIGGVGGRGGIAGDGGRGGGGGGGPSIGVTRDGGVAPTVLPNNTILLGSGGLGGQGNVPASNGQAITVR